MGEHKNSSNLEVAKLENAAILHEDNAEEDYSDFDINSPEAYIMLSFFQSEYKNASLDLAERIQNQLVDRVLTRISHNQAYASQNYSWFCRCSLTHCFQIRLVHRGLQFLI